jgi:hypothetical protein
MRLDHATVEAACLDHLHAFHAEVGESLSEAEAQYRRKHGSRMTSDELVRHSWELIESEAGGFTRVELGCRDRLDQRATRVVTQHFELLQQPAQQSRVDAELREFIRRMVDGAIAKRYTSHEDTEMAAESRCGLFFWC